ncbi:MAG: hypothetical protein P1U32_05765 [Legionellaceae bacterium]|nr:hypothetical protein [Legionellaceae bacterium]
MKNILFLDRSLTVNGTAVYFKNLASLLKQKAHIYFFPFKRHAYYKEIVSETRAIKWLPLVFGKYEIDIIYVCTAEMFILALFLKNYFFKHAKIVYSVFHPRQNFFETNIFGDVYKKVIYKKMLESPETFVFHNDFTKLNHEAHYEIILERSKIFPVLIGQLKASKDESPLLQKTANVIKIVSLGRLVDFKYYHEAVIQALLELNQAGDMTLEYHIYGDGHLRDKLGRFIKDKKASSFVFLHGHLETHKLYACLISADIVIGMGTSLMYAASLGIPSIVAIESSEATYGFFTDDMPGYECGEDMGDESKMSYSSVIKSFIHQTPSERAALKQKTLVKSKQYFFENNLDNFVGLLHEPERTSLAGISWFSFMTVLFAKVGIRLLPKRVGDK